MQKIVVCLLLLLSKFAYTQQGEQVFFHTNKDLYFPGETIWFKSYLFRNGKPAGTATNFYVSLHNEQGRLIAKKKYPIINAVSMGSIEIPDSIKSPVLQLRGLTIYNTDRQYNAQKIVRLYHAGRADSCQAITHFPDTVLHISPEGGSITAGINNYIYCSTRSSDGWPVPCSLWLLNSKNELLDSFKTDKNGLLSFQLNPKENELYKIKYSSQGSTREQYFGAAKAVWNLHTEIAREQLFYKIEKQAGTAYTEHLKIVLLHGNDTVYNSTIHPNHASNYINSIPCDSLPGGLIRFCLLNHNDEWLQQKNIYLPEKNAGLMSVVKNFNPGAANSIEISLPVKGMHNLSLSITDAAFADSLTPASIFSAALLHNVPAPDMYSNFTTEANQKLINGHLQTTPVVTEKNPGTAQHDNYLSLNFGFSDAQKSFSPDKLSIILKDKAYGNRFFSLNTGSQKMMAMPGIIFYDSATLFLQLELNKQKNALLTARLTDEPAFAQTVAPYLCRPLVKQNRPALDTFILHPNHKATETLQAVVVKSRYQNPIIKRILELDDKYASGMFKGIAKGFQFNVLDEPNAWGYPDVFSYLIYRVPARMYVKTSFGSRKLMMGDPISGGCEVVTFVNESQIMPEQLESIPMNSIAYIKFITGINVGSSFVNKCAVLYIYTRKGDEPDPDDKTGRKKITLKGYDLAADFPAVDNSANPKPAQPDRRSCLYWNPLLPCDNLDKIKIEYFNNDFSKSHIVKLTGYLDEGTLVEITKRIK